MNYINAEITAGLFFSTFNGCGFCGKIFAEVAFCKLGILRKSKVKTLDFIYLNADFVCGKPKNMTAKGFVAAEVVKVPTGKINAVYIFRTIHGDYVAACILAVEFTLIFCNLGESRIRLIV